MENEARVPDGVDKLSFRTGGGGMEKAEGWLKEGSGRTPDVFVRALALLLRVATDGFEYALCAFHPLTAAAGLVEVAVDGINGAKPLRV